MNAIETGSNLDKKNLDHQHFWPIYKAAEELGTLIFVHPWDMDSWSGRTSKYWLPWLVGKSKCLKKEKQMLSDIMFFVTSLHTCKLTKRKLNIWGSEEDKLLWEKVFNTKIYRKRKFLHYYFLGMPSETALAISCVLMGGILDKFPRLKLCFAHGGGSYPQIAGRISHGFKVRPDLCATDCTKNPCDFNGRFWTDSLVHDTSALRQLISTIGEVVLLNCFNKNLL
jgi:hypothetical protein